MNEKKIPVSIKLDSTVFTELEDRRGDISRGPFIEEILTEYFFREEKYDRNTQKYPDMIQYMEEENAFLRERVNRLETMLDQEQKLHLQTQHQLQIPERTEKSSILNKLKFW